MVYFIQSQDTRNIKIGFSRTLRGVLARITSLQTGNSDRLALLGVIDDDGTTNREKELHKEYSSDWLCGEWYRCTIKLLNFIDHWAFIKSPQECLYAVKEETKYVEKLRTQNALKKKTLIPMKYYNGVRTRIVDKQEIKRLERERFLANCAGDDN